MSALALPDAAAPVEPGALLLCPGPPPNTLPEGCAGVICREAPAAGLGVPALVLPAGAPWAPVITDLVEALQQGSGLAGALAARAALRAPLVDDQGFPGLAAAARGVLGAPVAILDEYLDLRGAAGLTEEQEAVLDAAVVRARGHGPASLIGPFMEEEMPGRNRLVVTGPDGPIGVLVAWIGGTLAAGRGRGAGRARRRLLARARPRGGAHRDRVAPARRPHRGADGRRGRQPRVAGAPGPPPGRRPLARRGRPHRPAAGPPHRGPRHHRSAPHPPLPAAGARGHGHALAPRAGQLERGPPAGAAAPRRERAGRPAARGGRGPGLHPRQAAAGRDPRDRAGPGADARAVALHPRARAPRRRPRRVAPGPGHRRAAGARRARS